MDKYVFISHLGKGNFGAVAKIKRKHDNKVLIWKELSYAHLSQKEKQQIVTEVNVLRELNHPNIVSYVDRIIDKKNLKLYIVMEYCEKGDLSQLIKRLRKSKTRLPEMQIWEILCQLALALKHCHHHKRVLHRDIKASNVFQDKHNVIKLGDFGLSKVLDGDSVFAYSKVGTPYYMSPEQIDERKYNEKSDIWSLGCLLYELCELHPPFEAKTHVQLAMKIKNGKVDRVNDMYSDELWRCIKRMLKVDVDKRADIDEVMNMPMVYLRVKEKELMEWERKLNEKEEMLREKEVILMQQQKQLQLQMQMYNGSQMSNYTSYKSTNANSAEGSESKDKHSKNNSHNNNNNNHLYIKNSNSMEYLITTQQNQINNMADNNNNNNNIPHTMRSLNYKLKDKMATFMSSNNIRKSCEPVTASDNNTSDYRMKYNVDYNNNNNVNDVYQSVEVLKSCKHRKTNSICKRASTPNLMMMNVNANNNAQNVVCGNYTTSNLHRNTISHNYQQGSGSNVISMIRNNSSNQLHVLRNAYTSDVININSNISTPSTTRIFKRKKTNN